MFTPSNTLALALAAAALAAAPAAQAQLNAGTALSGSLVIGQPLALSLPVNLVNFSSVTVGSGVELAINQFNGPAPILDDSDLSFDWATTATGGQLTINYVMRTSSADNFLFQFRSADTGAVFSNWRRISDNFGNHQTAGNATGWAVTQIGNQRNGLVFSITDLQVFPGANSYTGNAIYAFDYMPSAVPEPGTYGLMALGLAALAFTARRQRQTARA